VRSILTALGWVLLALASLGSGLLALWVTSSMARATTEGAGDFTASAAWTWIVAIVITFGIPFALATWKGHGDARKISMTMTWLPMVWNTGGLILASQLVPDVVGRALRSHGAWVAAQEFGDSHAATRVLSALGHHTADLADPLSTGTITTRAAPRITPFGTHGVAVDEERAIQVPFVEEGTAILMDVTLEGEDERIDATYLFDTGASFTTVSSPMAKKLGIVVPEDAPTLKFNTASGPRESRMVFLRGLQLKSVYIPGLLASVCDACVNERTEGLLGLNVMREFFVQMDYKNHRMTLLPRTRTGRPNRAYDIQPVVDLSVEGTPEVWLGRVRWIVLIHNRGTRAIEDVTPVVKFSDGPSLLGRTVLRIQPGEVGRSLVEGDTAVESRGDSQGLFTLTLFEAFW
jgi:hypothetical protein